MRSRRHTTAATLIVVTMAASACVRTSEGVPVAESPATATSSTPGPTGAAPTTDNSQPPPGIVPTTRAPLPVDAVTCSPSVKPVVAVLAQIADPQAPRITVAVPTGWGMSVGTGDVGARLTGPNGMFATVTIAATRLDPEAAFREYTDEVMDQAAVSTVSILPAELCAYSGQKLMGAWSDEPANSVEFTDRIVHVWTNAGDYLVAVHVQAPTEAKQDDAAIALLTDDFEIRIP
jgi:hypothetical protein